MLEACNLYDLYNAKHNVKPPVLIRTSYILLAISLLRKRDITNNAYHAHAYEVEALVAQI